ncbi:biotin/lipoate--protein ligase family protein [Methylobacterium sp. ID0610]|uniref:biotin/lipoate--protein ligase family protein n=1 Tax=Methylobacterium carpenticola TaxID=3344827 RepID=UPI0036ABE5DA
MTSRPVSSPRAGLVLPPGFSERVATGDAHAEACRLAGAGEAPATLVLGTRSDLIDLAVVLAPDEPLRSARRAVFAGMAALADAVGVFGPPDIPVRFHWPATLMFNGARLGGGRLGWPATCAEDAEPDWLVFSAMLIVSKAASGDPGLTPDSTALEEEGFPPDLHGPFAESFARHLTKTFEIWREDGFGHVAARYLARLDGESGRRAALDDAGDARFSHPDGRTEHAPLARALLAPGWHDPETGAVRL